MTRFIDADPLYDQIAEKEELARQRVLDTPTHYDGRVNPTYIRYSAQADERTNMRKMVMDAPTIDAEVLKCEHCDHNHGRDFVDCELLPQMFGRVAWENYCSLGEPKEEPDVSEG